MFYIKLSLFIRIKNIISKSQHKKLFKSAIRPRIHLVFIIIFLLMAFALNAMFSRLFRPFSSNTMRYSPDGSSGTSTTTSATLPIPANAQKATVAGGCFWGVEHIYRKTFGGNQPETNKGLLDARVGYVGGTTKNPTYPAVCSGRTGRKLFFLFQTALRAVSYSHFFIFHSLLLLLLISLQIRKHCR